MKKPTIVFVNVSCRKQRSNFRNNKKMPIENVYDSIRIQLNLQTLGGISPFIRRGNTLISNRWIQLYSLFLIIGYGATVHINFHILTQNLFERIFQIGYLWGIMITFELVFTNTAYPFIVAHALVFKKKQMDFINRIHTVDQILTDYFHIDLKPAHRFMRKRTLVFLTTSLIYYTSLHVGLVYGLYRYSVITVSSLIYSILYEIEQGTTGLLCATMLNSFYLMRSRFVALHLHLPKLFLLDKLSERNLKDGRRRRQSSVTFKLKLAKWCNMFKELCLLLDLLSETMGAILILRLMHDFIVLLFQLYIILYMCMEGNKSENFSIVYVMAAWMFQNVVKIIAISISAHLTRNDVSKSG